MSTSSIEWTDATRRWRGNFITLPERLSDPLGWKKPRRVFVRVRQWPREVAHAG